MDLYKDIGLFELFIISKKVTDKKQLLKLPEKKREKKNTYSFYQQNVIFNCLNLKRNGKKIKWIGQRDSRDGKKNFRLAINRKQINLNDSYGIYKFLLKLCMV